MQDNHEEQFNKGFRAACLKNAGNITEAQSGFMPSSTLAGLYVVGAWAAEKFGGLSRLIQVRPSKGYWFFLNMEGYRPLLVKSDGTKGHLDLEYREAFPQVGAQVDFSHSI